MIPTATATQLCCKEESRFARPVAPQKSCGFFFAKRCQWLGILLYGKHYMLYGKGVTAPAQAPYAVRPRQGRVVKVTAHAGTLLAFGWKCAA